MSLLYFFIKSGNYNLFKETLKKPKRADIKPITYRPSKYSLLKHLGKESHPFPNYYCLTPLGIY